MKNYSAIIITTLFFLFNSFLLQAQDIHLSHIHASPTFLNPAMTGVFNGQARFIGNTKLQWNTVTKGYKTAIGSVDMKLIPTGKHDYVSGGIQLISDVAGDLDFSNKSVGLSVAYLKSFDAKGKNIISLGFQSSYIQNSFDISKVVAFDYLPGLSKSINTNINYMDLSVGINWFSSPSKNNSYYFGIAAAHLNDPIVSFRDNENPERANVLYRKLTIHGGADFQVSKLFNIKPSFIFVDQGPHREINVGSFVRYKTHYGPKRKPVYYTYLGAWVRSYIENDTQGIDAIVASFRFDYRSMYLTFSYDINVSTYKAASGGRGGAEFSIVKLLNWERHSFKKTRVKCPIL